MLNGLISVVMSIYNENLEWIKESIDSILNQTYSKLELIIIIDNPHIEEVVKEYLCEVAQIDNRVIVIWNEKNIGLAQSLNKGIEVAKGEYIARMDADDISDAYRLEYELNEIEKYNLDVIGTGKINIDEEGRICSNYEGCIVGNDSIKKILPYTSCFVHPSIMIRSKVLKEVKGYRNFRQSQDYDLWLRLLSYGCRFGNIDKPLLKYRVRTNSITGKLPYCQYLTSFYQIKLYKQRKRNREDFFSEDDFRDFLIKHGAFDDSKNRNYIVALETLNRGINKIRDRKIFGGMCHILKAVHKCSCIRNILFTQIRVYKIRRVSGS